MPTSVDITARPQTSPWAVGPVVIAGAGIAGLATARALTKVGIPALVLESGPGPRNEGAAIGLWSNAWRALDALDAAELLRKAHVPINRMEICRPDGHTLRAFDFTQCGPPGQGQEYRFVRRSALLAALAEGLPLRSVRYGCKVVRVVEGIDGAVAVELAGGERVQCGALVGADGVASAVSAHLGLGLPNITGYSALRGIAKFPGGIECIPRNVVRQLFGRGVRFGLSAMTPTECYWYITVNGPIQAGLAPQQLLDLGAALVRGWGGAAEEVVRATELADVSSSRLGDRWTVGAYGRGAVTLVGDAAHPMTPNLGQGGCTALEDAVVLALTLSAAACGRGGAGRPTTSDPAEPALAAALRQYEAARSRRCLPLTVRAWAYGQVLQLPQAPVCVVRDAFLSHLFSPADLLDHTAFDCGALDRGHGV